MSTYKTKVNSAMLDAFLHDHVILKGTKLEMIADGEDSQAYFFVTSTGPKVLRINAHTKIGFQKDKMAYERFARPDVPIPKIEEIGRLPGGAHFAVSTRSPGKTLDKLTSDEFIATLPAIIRTMDAIHQTAPIGAGYGYIQLDGTGKYSSWHEALDHDQKDKEEPGKLAACEFFEQEIYDHLRTKIKEYYHYCPNDIRRLVHRDYGFQNTLAQNGQITGVIDWHDAQYGDPMYDVAWFDFWSPLFKWPVNVVSSIKQYYVDQNRLPDNFDERLTCYKLIIGANSMSFFAKSDQKKKYAWARDEVLKIYPNALAKTTD